ncbi:CRISPR-associated endonuclease Cas1 [Gloeocapsa sp. PCC 73106]|uniref:CRISPR-associated endonuclease Cas1 n=1 Tax=Gloeocapsa sp. PCC 73106 TaxID=102232 RepID=UPI0002AC3836|nr:CRISPR-associated endonuclease Cas1 [Gloeocapsa sp. PCC 73106]ELR98433.1 CRISPR-associated endonuclease Cas1 [Gloeocapsa sp. PCC 73106]
MATLYLMEQQTWLHKENQRFVVQINKKEKREILIREINQILLFGNIQITTPAINTCLQEQIIVLFLSQSGQYNGHLWSLEANHLNLEITQIQKHRELAFQLPVCRGIVLGKILNCRQLLLRLNRKRKLKEIEEAIIGIDADLKKAEIVEDIDQLRGYEGVSASRYFPALGKLIVNPDFQFSQRHRQPPTDPVNSLLSFGYTLLFNNVLSLIIAEGLSPYFGNFHYGERKKPYLAFDLMEEFRSPIVDSLVLRLVNTPLVSSEDFEQADNDGVYLSNSARKTFLTNFENRLNQTISHPDQRSPVTYRQVIHLQVRRYKQYLLSGTPYQPFVRST